MSFIHSGTCYDTQGEFQLKPLKGNKCHYGYIFKIYIQFTYMGNYIETKTVSMYTHKYSHLSYETVIFFPF